MQIELRCGVIRICGESKCEEECRQGRGEVHGVSKRLDDNILSEVLAVVWENCMVR